MEPHYFKRELSIAEAEAYVEGLMRRYRQSWEQARLVSFYSVAPWSNNLSPDKLMQFAWDKEGHHATIEPSKEEIDELRLMASQYMKEHGTK